jgi:hypothetical protein
MKSENANKPAIRSGAELKRIAALEFIRTIAPG